MVPCCRNHNDSVDFALFNIYPHRKDETQISKIYTRAKDFADAVKNNEEEIIIEGDLANHVLRIKATGKVAWAVCAACIAAAIAFFTATPAVTVATTPVGGGVSFAVGSTMSVAAMSAAATTTLGTAVVPAIVIGVCAGGIGVLNTLRDKYKIVDKGKKYLKLRRK